MTLTASDQNKKTPDTCQAYMSISNKKGLSKLVGVT